MAGDSFPQSKSLATIRRFIEEALASGAVKAAGKAVGLDSRHVSYHAAAAEALRLAHRKNGGLEALPLGRRLLATDPGSAEEAAVLREAIETSPVTAAFAALALGPKMPAVHDLARRLMASGLAESTARHRAGTLLRWRETVLGQERQPRLPHVSGATRREMRYSGRAMLRSLRIESFKAFGGGPAARQSTVEPIQFEPLTIFVGPNGAGKTTILQALELLGSLVRMNISEWLKAHGWEYSDLPHLRSKRPTIHVIAEIELAESVIEWTLELGTRLHPGIAGERVRARGRDDAAWRTLLHREGRRVTITDESTGTRSSLPLITLPQSWLATLDPASKTDARMYPGLLRLKAWAEGIHAFWSLDPSTLRSPSRGKRDGVGPRGEDLASFLFRLKGSDAKRFKSFVKRVTNHYPRLVSIEPRSSNYGWKHLDITERWNGEKATFNARQVSDGLLRLLVVASIPEWKVRPSIILLDEVENGLHPRMIAGIASLLAEVSSDVQIAATTHSPITLNYVTARSTRIVTRGRRGTVLVTPLEETKNYAKLREHFEPGELWYNAGEDRLVKPGR